MIPAKYWSPTKKLMVLGAMAGGKSVEATATGNPLSFVTDLAKPLKSLLVPFLPVQSGSGDPSPQNIRPIVAWDGVKLFSGNSNLLTGENRKPNLYSLSSDGTITAVNPSSQGYAWSYDNSIFVVYLPAGKYTVVEEVVTTPTYTGTGFQVRDENNGWLAERGYATFTLSQGGKVGIICKPQNGAFRYSIVKGTAGEYEKQETTETDISFPSPVYGGTLDVVSGVLTVEYVAKKLSDFSWTYTTTGGANAFRTGRLESQMKTSQSAILLYCDSLNPVSPVTTYGGMASKADKSIFQLSASDEKRIIVKDNDHTVVNDFLEKYGNVMVAYPLATPQEITLTPEQITAIKGNNTIWSDANGNLTAVYLKKG